jgi:hypothetical protein
MVGLLLLFYFIPDAVKVQEVITEIGGVTTITAGGGPPHGADLQGQKSGPKEAQGLAPPATRAPPFPSHTSPNVCSPDPYIASSPA